MPMLAEPCARKSKHSPATPLERLRAYLDCYWLRPENALWMTLRSMALDQAPWRGRAGDICCGDGLFTFLHLGGRLAPEFDVFAAAGNLDAVTHRHADMFDTPAAAYAPVRVAEPSSRVAVGIDLKENLLHRAEALGCYERLVQHDSNAPLPLPDASLDTVYCNAAYWVQEIDGFLSELRRVVAPGGALVLHVKLADMRRFTLLPLRRELGDPFLELIGRGRLSCWPSLLPRREWERRFRTAGLQVDSCVPLATRTHAQLWDVGLRPLAPLLVRMTQAIDAPTRAAIKREWVELVHELAAPLCRHDLSLMPDGTAPAELQYVLRSQ